MNFCWCCNNELPIKNFYIYGKKKYPAKHCKECIKKYSKQERASREFQFIFKSIKQFN